MTVRPEVVALLREMPLVDGKFRFAHKDGAAFTEGEKKVVLGATIQELRTVAGVLAAAADQAEAAGRDLEQLAEYAERYDCTVDELLHLVSDADRGDVRQLLRRIERQTPSDWPA